MAQALDSICFYCGQAFSLSAMNRVRGGKPCPVCTERLLDALSPLLPGPGSQKESHATDSVGLGEPGEGGSTWGPAGGSTDLPEPA